MKICRALILGLCVTSMAGVASADGPLGYQAGAGGSPVSGSAGTSGAVGANGLQKCDKAMGAMAVAEPQTYAAQALSQYGLQTPTSLIRLMIQQSNCFLVVERGMGMHNAMQERELAASGELRQNSNLGGGQLVAADFILTPNVVFSENDAGGLQSAVGGLLGRHNALLGSVAGGVKFKEAQTSMLVTDSRSGLQVAAAEGSTRKADLNLAGMLTGSTAAGSLGGYANTNEGKIIAAALMDNYNKVVLAVRNDPSLQREVGSLRDEAARKTVSGAVFSDGDVVSPKIGNVSLLAQPKEGSKVVATLGRAEELVVIGPEQDGYLNVQGSAAAGWVRKVLVVRH